LPPAFSFLSPSLNEREGVYKNICPYLYIFKYPRHTHTHRHTEENVWLVTSPSLKVSVWFTGLRQGPAGGGLQRKAGFGKKKFSVCFRPTLDLMLALD
jgi:hypothetical protein